jgi:uncharacterized coiled-coil protein SlyX
VSIDTFDYLHERIILLERCLASTERALASAQKVIDSSERLIDAQRETIALLFQELRRRAAE